MAVAKIRKNTKKKEKKTFGQRLKSMVMPNSSDKPGQVDYQSIAKARESLKKKRKMLDEMTSMGL